MLLRCLIERAGGSVVTFGNGENAAVYRFVPNDQGHHVADVATHAHAAALLGIAEGYEAYPSDPLSAADLVDLLGDAAAAAPPRKRKAS